MITLDFLAALLSSELLSWTLKRRGRAWRGEWTGARAANLNRLSIAEPDRATQREIVDGCDACRRIASELDVAVTDADKDLLGRLTTTRSRRSTGASSTSTRSPLTSYS